MMEIVGFNYAINSTTVQTRSGTLKATGEDELTVKFEKDGAYFFVAVPDYLLTAIKEVCTPLAQKAIDEFVSKNAK